MFSEESWVHNKHQSKSQCLSNRTEWNACFRDAFYNSHFKGLLTMSVSHMISIWLTSIVCIKVKYFLFFCAIELHSKCISLHPPVWVMFCKNGRMLQGFTESESTEESKILLVLLVLFFKGKEKYRITFLIIWIWKVNQLNEWTPQRWT